MSRTLPNRAASCGRCSAWGPPHPDSLLGTTPASPCRSGTPHRERRLSFPWGPTSAQVTQEMLGVRNSSSGFLVSSHVALKEPLGTHPQC